MIKSTLQKKRPFTLRNNDKHQYKRIFIKLLGENYNIFAAIQDMPKKW